MFGGGVGWLGCSHTGLPWLCYGLYCVCFVPSAWMSLLVTCCFSCAPHACVLCAVVLHSVYMCVGCMLCSCPRCAIGHMPHFCLCPEPICCWDSLFLTIKAPLVMDCTLCPCTNVFVAHMLYICTQCTAVCILCFCTLHSDSCCL